MTTREHDQRASTPTVYIIGTGPANPDDVSHRALRIIAGADAIVHDPTVPAELLRAAPVDAVRISAGAMTQAQINARLIELTQQYACVVRLHAGDAYVSAAGAEEALQCRAHRVAFEVVPAVSSAVAIAAYAGIPVTHAGLSASVTTGAAASADAAWLAASPGTVVLEAPSLTDATAIVQSLLSHRAPATRPTAVVVNGASVRQRTITGTLSTIVRELARAGLAPETPCTLVVGDVVELRDQLSWFEQRPLFGRRVAVTRARAQASELARRLRSLGADVLETPAIMLEDAPTAALDALLATLDEVSVLVLTSRNGVDRFFARLAAARLDARALARVRVAVVGKATAAACREHGIVPDIVPDGIEQTAHGLLRLLGNEPLFGTRVVVVRAERGDDTFLDGLAALGAQVELVVAYRTLVEQPAAGVVQQLLECDAVTFTSESTVQSVAGWIPPGAALPPAITIGPVTTKAALWHGFRVLGQASEPSLDALVHAVLDNLDKRGTLPA